MLFCDACGNQNREQARFCGHCGQPLQAQVPEPSEKVGEPPLQSESKSKSVTVSGFTKSQREAELARIRKKFESRGWVFVDYRDEFLGGKATFQVPARELQHMRRRNWLIGAAIIAVIVIAKLLPDSPKTPSTTPTPHLRYSGKPNSCL